MLDINVSMKIVTCHCGGLYCIPNWVSSFTCPFCANRRIEKIEERHTEKLDEIYHLHSVNAGLRGALKRMKRINRLHQG